MFLYFIQSTIYRLILNLGKEIINEILGDIIINLNLKIS